MLNETACDLVMIGRATLGNPWFIKECVESVNRLLKDNGRFYFVHRCTFLNEILEVLSLYHFHIKTMQIAYDKKSMQAKSFCMEVIRDSKCQCTILPVKWI